jgi:negative regulator of sigma E activity
MTDPNQLERLRQVSWRRKLTPEEMTQATGLLRDHPEEAADWALEQNLTAAFRKLPDAPVSSNFTARVMAAIDAEEVRTDRGRQREGFRAGWERWLLRWMPKAAAVAAVAIVALVSHGQFEARKHADLAESLSVVSQVQALPPPAILADFDAIQAMGGGSYVGADEDLLLLLQ